MSGEKLDYSVVLADMEAKRAALDAAITHMRIFLAGQVAENGSNGTSSVSSIPTGEVPAGAFLGKSIPEAAKLYLQIMKRKATSKDIGDALRRGGMESTSNNFNGIVHAVLDRYRKSGGDIVKLDRSMWGLAEWYPTGVRATVSEKPKKRKAKAKIKAKPPQAMLKTEPTKTKPAPVPANATGLEGKIEAILLSDKTKVFSSADIAAQLDILPQAVALACGRMAAKNKAEKAQGGYRAFSVQEMSLAG